MSIAHFSSSINVSQPSGPGPNVAQFSPTLVNVDFTNSSVNQSFVGLRFNTDGTYVLFRSNNSGTEVTHQSGTWRAGGTVDTTSYQYRISHNESGLTSDGSVNALGGASINNTYQTVATNGLGIEVRLAADIAFSDEETQGSNITIEIREIANTSNTTGSIGILIQITNERLN